MTTETLPPRRSARRFPAVWQPRQPVFWLVAVLLLALGALMMTVLIGMAPEPGATFLAIGLILPQVAALGLITHLLPQFRRQPISLRIVALAWGAFVAVTAAMIVGPFGDSLVTNLGLRSVSAAITAPLSEDTLRLLGVFAVLILAYKHRITVMDGVVYGFIVGAGFELMENFIYMISTGQPEAIVRSGLLRLLVGFGLHPLWSAAAGAVLAYTMSRAQRGLPTRWWLLIPAVLIPMSLHGAWDSPALSILVSVKLASCALLYLVSVALLLLATSWGRRADVAALSWALPEGLTYRMWKATPRKERRVLAAEAVREDERKELKDL